MIWRAVALIAVIGLSGCMSLNGAGVDDRGALASNVQRYVVITVRNTSSPLLPRAGSTLRDYDSARTYGISPAARKQLTSLASAHRLREVEGWTIAALGVHCAIFELPDDIDLAQALNELSRDRRIESVQPLNLFGTLSTNADPYRSLQRNLDVMQVGLAHAWSRGEKTRVAVIDTGIDALHPDLAGRVVVQRNFVDASPNTPAERHGTAVAGVIAAIDNNREGITGVAPAASIIGLRACWPKGLNAASAVCNTFTLAKALAAALDENSHVVNLSLGGPVDPLLERLVEVGAKRGLIYVGALPSGPLGFPCDVAKVICVGTAGQPDPTPALFAPGIDVLTLVPQGRYDFLSGSSLAAANVAGSIALLRARDRDLTSDLARHLLRPAADSVDSAASINVCDALARLLGRPECSR